MKPYKEVSSKKGTSTGILEDTETIAVESNLDLYVNDRLIHSFVYSPGFIKEMVVGHLLSSGTIPNLAYIKSMNFEETSCRVEVEEPMLHRMDLNSRKLQQEYLNTVWDVSRSFIMELAAKVTESQELHTMTGAAHAALLQDLETGRRVVVEDIGRYNAVDKVIGLALNEGPHLEQAGLFLTGRLTSQLVTKAAAISFPLVASLAVATDRGIEIARTNNITLIGAFRGDEFRIYHHGRTQISI